VDTGKLYILDVAYVIPLTIFISMTWKRHVAKNISKREMAISLCCRVDEHIHLRPFYQLNQLTDRMDQCTSWHISGIITNKLCMCCRQCDNG